MKHRAGAAPGRLLAVVIASAGCGGGSGPGAPLDEFEGIVLDAVSEPVPLTVTYVLALVADDRVCMVDSYEKQVHCGDRAWDDVLRFGREGEGPGEYGAIVGLVPLPNDRLGVIDNALQRLTVVDPAGELERTVPFEAAPWLTRSASDSIFPVTTLGFESWMPDRQEARRRTRTDWVAAGEGIIRTQTLVLPDTAATHAHPLVAGAWSPEHGFAFVRAPYQIVRFSPDGDFIGLFTPFHYVPELPNRRDIEDRAAGLRFMFGQTPSNAELRGYAAEPKNGTRGGMALTFTDDGLLWIATTRDRDRWSYIDVFAGGTRYVGSVRVRDRLYGYDVRNGTLAVLVERSAPGPDGVRPYAIDWYDVTEWVAERLTSEAVGAADDRPAPGITRTSAPASPGTRRGTRRSWDRA